jgi:phosphoribosylglycinamide formyltransferase-1
VAKAIDRRVLPAMIVAVFASHEGTTLQAILDACGRGVLDARVGIVVSNNADSGAIRRARAAGIAHVHLSGKTHPDAEALDRAILGAIEGAAADVIFLAGYMKKLGPLTLGQYAGRVFNTHPALLPRYGGKGMYGMNVHRAVLAAGEVESGATVHLVDGGYDTGPIVAQRRVAVLPGDTPETLAERVQACERGLVVAFLGDIVQGKTARQQQGPQSRERQPTRV